MTSGIGYRCNNLHHNVLHFFPDLTRKLYKAPASKASKTHGRTKALITSLPLKILHLILLNLDLVSLKENSRHWVQEWKRQKQQGNSARCPRRQSISTTLGNNGELGSWRMQATVTFPYWDRHTQTLEPGTFCRAPTHHWEDGNWNDSGAWSLMGATSS